MSDEKDKVEGQVERQTTEDKPQADAGPASPGSAVKAVIALIAVVASLGLTGYFIVSIVSTALNDRVTAGEEVAIVDVHRVTVFQKAFGDNGAVFRPGSECWLQEGGKVTTVEVRGDYVLARYTAPLLARRDDIFTVCPDGTLTVMAKSDVRYFRYRVKQEEKSLREENDRQQAEQDLRRQMGKPKTK